MKEPTNQERAKRAGFAIDTYWSHDCPGPCPLVEREDTLTDLLTDLQHWAKREEIDYAESVRRAWYHFDCEDKNHGMDLPPEKEPVSDEVREAFRELRGLKALLSYFSAEMYERGKGSSDEERECDAIREKELEGYRAMDWKAGKTEFVESLRVKSRDV